MTTIDRLNSAITIITTINSIRLVGSTLEYLLESGSIQVEVWYELYDARLLP